MHGQEIASELEKRKGIRPSPGTVYPALKALKKSALIKEKKSGKKIVYTLTDDGKATLKFAKQKFCRIFMGVF